MIERRGVGRGAATTIGSALIAIVVTQLPLPSSTGFVGTRDFISLGMFDTDPYRGQLYMVTFVFAVSAITVALAHPCS